MITIREYYRQYFGSRRFEVNPSIGVYIDGSYDDVIDTVIGIDVDTSFDPDAKEDEQHFTNWLIDQLIPQEPTETSFYLGGCL